MKDTINILVCGVGGQGSVRASHILAEAAVRAGLRARVGETFGAAQRGGAVASHVRIGKNVNAPIISKDGADVIVGLEPLETIRNVVKFASPDAIVIMEKRPIYPAEVNIGLAEYPSIEEITEAIQKLVKKVIVLDATNIAINAGNLKTLNVVLLGALAALNVLPYSKETLLETIKENVPPKTIDVNVKAFNAGIQAMNELNK